MVVFSSASSGCFVRGGGMGKGAMLGTNDSAGGMCCSFFAFGG